jgi:glycosyltransferase involved in cell wall biosynthesis
LNGSLSGPDPLLPEYRAFVPRGLHWRLEGTTLHHLFTNEMQERRLAQDMWAWVRPFEPEVLWVVPELAAVPVARHLHRLSGLPIHATVHDAPATCVLAGVPRLYSQVYQRGIRDVMQNVSSMDCIGPELMAHMQKHFDAEQADAVVVRPTVAPESLKSVRAREWGQSNVRRIGLCGSFRIEDDQWSAFLRHLGRLPFTFEFISFTPPDAVPSAKYPKNVSLHFEPYVSRDVELVEAFDRAAVDACYLGIWNTDANALFGQTSLSSKLTTYSAAAVPVIVHGRHDAAAWHLVDHYKAGIRFNENEAGTHDALLGVLSDRQSWADRAEGARRLCEAEFSLETNVAALTETLSRTVKTWQAR